MGIDIGQMGVGSRHQRCPDVKAGRLLSQYLATFYGSHHQRCADIGRGKKADEGLGAASPLIQPHSPRASLPSLIFSLPPSLRPFTLLPSPNPLHLPPPLPAPSISRPSPSALSPHRAPVGEETGGRKWIRAGKEGREGASGRAGESPPHHVQQRRRCGSRGCSLPYSPHILPSPHILHPPPPRARGDSGDRQWRRGRMGLRQCRGRTSTCSTILPVASRKDGVEGIRPLS